jgi:hypothetical protein
MIERRIPHAEVAEAYQAFLADRAKTAGFDLARRVFGIGDEQNVNEAEEE